MHCSIPNQNTQLTAMFIAPHSTHLIEYHIKPSKKSKAYKSTSQKIGAGQHPV